MRGWLGDEEEGEWMRNEKKEMSVFVKVKQKSQDRVDIYKLGQRLRRRLIWVQDPSVSRERKATKSGTHRFSKKKKKTPHTIS